MPLSSSDLFDRYIKRTRLIRSRSTERYFEGHELYFKLENEQITGSFKARGVVSKLLSLEPKDQWSRVVSYGTGNHGAALSWAAPLILGVNARVFLPKTASRWKIDHIRKLGGEVVVVSTRDEAEKMALEDSCELGAVLVPPSSDPAVINGASTVVAEILEEMQPEAIFVPIGGGSLAAGTLLAREKLAGKFQVHGVEPLLANDVAISLRTGSLFRFGQTPSTAADGVTTLGVTPLIFKQLKFLDSVQEVSEQEILYWHDVLAREEGVACELTSAVALAGAYRLCQQRRSWKVRIVVVITGSNCPPVQP